MQPSMKKSRNPDSGSGVDPGFLKTGEQTEVEIPLSMCFLRGLGFGGVPPVL